MMLTWIALLLLMQTVVSVVRAEVAAQEQLGGNHHLRHRQQRSIGTLMCHFPLLGDKSRFQTRRVLPFLVERNKQRGDLVGSCEENCGAICLGTSDSPPLINRSSMTLPECTQRCLPAGGSIAVVMTDNTSPADLRIAHCDHSTVEIRGLRAADIAAGFILINVSGDAFSKICTDCLPLFRKVVSVKDGSVPGSKILTTSMATFKDILGAEIIGPAIHDELIELSAGCAHSRPEPSRRNMLANTTTPLSTAFNRNDWDSDNHAENRNLQIVAGQSCSSIKAVHTDGRCKFTRCVAFSDDCFVGEASRDKGCEAINSIASFDGKFDTFDFSEACCAHDYCYSSTSSIFDKRTCDINYHKNLVSQCSPLSNAATLLLPSSTQCNILAMGLFLAFHLGGGAAYVSAQAEQTLYEQTNTCTLKCPAKLRANREEGAVSVFVNVTKTTDFGNIAIELDTGGSLAKLEIKSGRDELSSTDGFVDGLIQYTQLDVSLPNSIVEVIGTHGGECVTPLWAATIGCIVP